MATVDARGVVPQQFTGFLLRRAYVVSRAQAEACIGDEVTVREVPALTLIRDEVAISQRRLGELLNLNRTSIGKLVDLLEAKGWVTRERLEHDRRSYALRLTASGADALSELHHALARGDEQLTEPLTASEQKRLAATLRLLLTGDPTVAITGLGTRCGYLIARAHATMFRRATDALRPLGLTPRDFGVLSALSVAQPCSQQRMAAILGVSAPAVLGFVDELESQGLVERRRNATDRRAYDLTLSATGEQVLQQAKQVALDLQSRIVDTLGPKIDEELRRLLAKVVEAGPAQTATANAAGHRSRDRLLEPHPT